MRRPHMLVIGALALLVLVIPGCKPTLPAPAQTVESVLELRSKDSTDPAAYARYFKESSVATALAEDSAGAKGKSRIPEWKQPVVKASTDSSASVVVVWKQSATLKNWPKSTTFMLTKVGDRWVIVDATAESSEESKTP